VSDAIRAAFEAVPVSGRVPAWLRPIRQAGMERFAEVGFPGTRDEEWRFTPVTPVARAALAPASSPARPVGRGDLEPFTFGHPEWPRLVFVNGRFAPEVSTLPVLPAGVVFTSLAEALATRPELVEPHLARQAGPDATPFTALNAAFIQDGAFLYVPKDADLADPFVFVFVTTPDQSGRMSHPRNLVVVEPGARASLVEIYVGLDHTAAYLTNAVSEVVLRANAWLEHTRIQRESEASWHVAFSHVHQERDSHYRSFTLAMGAAISRHNLHTRLDAPNTEALLYGLSIAHGDQLVDNHTAIYHVQPDCRSWEVYKAILDDRSRGVLTARCWSPPRPRRPTPSRPTGPCCFRPRQRSTPSRSSRSSPTT
jgi:Fe-S cluster assembly protein SufD